MRLGLKRIGLNSIGKELIDWVRNHVRVHIWQGGSWKLDLDGNLQVDVLVEDAIHSFQGKISYC